MYSKFWSADDTLIGITTIINRHHQSSSITLHSTIMSNNSSMGALDAWEMSIANAKTKTFFFHKANLEPIECEYTTTS